MTYDLRAIARQFHIHGEFQHAEPYGGGHINDTYCALFDQAGTPVRYILQRINHHVFKNPGALMENVERVTSHLAKKIEGEPDASRRALRLIPARDGTAWHVDAQGNYWRTYLFVERARTYDAVRSAGQAFQVARAFGSFQRMLADLPAQRLHDTIPDFHNTRRRFAALEQAIARDVAGRGQLAGAEIDFAIARKPLTGILLDAGLPERVTHNDAKLDNVMLDDTTGEGVCVIDLDTVMSGLAVYDFGDMVRSTTSAASEDEPDLSKVGMQLSMFEALVEGYASTAGGFLTRAEKDHLVLAGKLITFEIGIRFLTDFLSGDVYFKTHREGHNLDRCRTQFQLVRSIEQQEAQMQAFVRQLVTEVPVDFRP
jgi:Ser/Thr protein kinase RdoA (MazF antagonist)